MSKTCLIIGSKGDVHVPALEAAMSARGVQVDVIDIEDQPSLAITVRHSRMTAHINGRDVREYGAILNRIKWRIDPCLTDDDKFASFFFNVEWIYALRGLMMTAISLGVPVLNGPLEYYRGSNKIFQLSIADACGFEVPDTFIGTEVHVLRGFRTRWPKAIAKVFDASFIPATADRENQHIPTSEMSGADFVHYEAEIMSNPPMIIQNNIEKAFEARVIASKHMNVCYLLHSQEHEYSVTDWRNHEVGVRTTIGELPREIHKAIGRFLDKTELHYGIFDFAIAPDGRWIFFECNPDGQWWVPRKRVGGNPEHVYADAVVRLLAADVAIA